MPHIITSQAPIARALATTTRSSSNNNSCRCFWENGPLHIFALAVKHIFYSYGKTIVYSLAAIPSFSFSLFHSLSDGPICSLSVSLFYEMSLCTPLAIGFLLPPPSSLSFIASFASLNTEQHIRIPCMYLIHIAHLRASHLHQFPQHHTHPTHASFVHSFGRSLARNVIVFLVACSVTRPLFLALALSLSSCIYVHSWIISTAKHPHKPLYVYISLQGICHLIYMNLPTLKLLLPYVYCTHMCVVC